MTTDEEMGFDNYPQSYWSTKPGALAEASCPVCGAACAIQRNILGPTGFAAAMARRAILHDRIVCPHAGTGWHYRAGRLRDETARTPSHRLASIMQEELDALILEHRRSHDASDAD